MIDLFVGYQGGGGGGGAGSGSAFAGAPMGAVDGGSGGMGQMMPLAPPGSLGGGMVQAGSGGKSLIQECDPWNESPRARPAPCCMQVQHLPCFV